MGQDARGGWGLFFKKFSLTQKSSLHVLIGFLVIYWKIGGAVEERVLVLVGILGLMSQLQLGSSCPGQVGMGRSSIASIGTVLLISAVN